MTLIEIVQITAGLCVVGTTLFNLWAFFYGPRK